MPLAPLDPPPRVFHSLADEPLAGSEVRLFCLDLDACVAASLGPESFLSAEERRYADQLGQPLSRRRFVTGRAILRHLLGKALDLEPARVPLTPSAAGKPVLADPAGPLFFNVSHREHLLLIALTRRAALGVDVELLSPLAALDVDALAADHFSPAQAQTLRSLPPQEKLRQFYLAWTLKEARIKAAGACLALDAALAGSLPARCASCPARDIRIPADGLVWQTQSALGPTSFVASLVLLH